MSAFPLDPSYCDSNLQSKPAAPPSAGKMADPPTLLVVDDDPFFRELEARALRGHGYNVLQAGGSAEALRLARATPAIDLLLTDFVMPNGNGLELARRFRALHPQSPVLVVSGSLPLLQGKGGELDRFAILEKSSTFDELLGKVHTLLTETSPPPLNTSLPITITPNTITPNSP
jgi:CheY-like chemotaxis protein